MAVKKGGNGNSKIWYTILSALVIVAFGAALLFYVQGHQNNSAPSTTISQDYRSAILTNKYIVLQPLTYPNQSAYNVIEVNIFYPTLTYIYYNQLYGTYEPVNWVNASYSEYNFNLTEYSPGYLQISYITNSSSGLSFEVSDCLANFFAGVIQENDYSNDNNAGNFTIPLAFIGKNCVYVSNPSNSKIEATISATYVQYP